MANSKPLQPKPKPASLKARVLAWIEENELAAIDESQWHAMATALSVPPDKLRRVLRECGLPLDPVVEGVRQTDLTELERTLCQLAAEYARGDAARRRDIRQIALTARQHAGWAERDRKIDEKKRAEKGEILLWIRTWLENPPLFPAWARLRARTLTAQEASHE